MTPAAAPVTVTVTRPRPVLSVTEHLHRDLAVARDVQAGRFAHLGSTLALGRRPDWFGGDPADVEWRIEWVKLYEGLDLAYAFTITGDIDLLRVWEDLVESFCDQVPVGHDSSDVSARRVQNWLYAWQRFASSPSYPGLRDGLDEHLVSRIRADAAHIAAHLTPERNHRTLELYTLLLVGLAFDADGTADTVGTGLWRPQDALAALADNAVADVWPDGVHRECSTDYHLIVLRSLLGAVANSRAAGIPVPAALLDRGQRACDFALHVQRPDGVTPALSDGDQGDFTSLLLLAADLLDRPDLRWAATAGAAGTPPAQRLVSFPVAGYHVQRSGWGEVGRPYAHERFCVLDCGPVGDGGHGHYDQLSVEIAAGGHSLVVDPGRYTYASDDAGWRHWFKGTAAHNTVCVDRMDQTPYRPGKPKGAVSRARLLGRESSAGLDVLRGEVTSPQYEAIHTRTILFVAADYWVVHDRLRGDRPHDYQARWHLDAPADGRTVIHAASGQVEVRMPGGALVVPNGFGAVTLEPGWVSPSYGVKHPAPIAVVAAAGDSAADLLTVILPGTDTAYVTATCHDDDLDVLVERPGIGVDNVRWTVGSAGSRWVHTPC